MTNLHVDPRETHRISPYLYMQFMEPLGTADASVDAAWDFAEQDWHPAVIGKVRELAPTMVRWGGCFASYYHWREGVGPQAQRVPMRNHMWGGVYQNQVGTHEILDFCRRVGADPLLVVNMETDGNTPWMHPKHDTCRFGTAEEAAEWVAYCNQPDHPLRLAHGAEAPYGVKYWQVGNETSYYPGVGYSSDQCAEVTKRFVEQMRKADPDIRIIAWGDRGGRGSTEPGENWCRRMSAIDGVDMVAFHHHFDSGLPDSPLTGVEYRRDWERTWEHLMHAHHSIGTHIDWMRANCAHGTRLAMTEGHFALPGRNRNEVLSSWGAGVAYARCHNLLMRNSDILDIATLADFFGNLWQVNAVMIPTPIWSGQPYLQPVGHVMALFGRHQGQHAVTVSGGGKADVVASRTGDTLYLHCANTDAHLAQELELTVEGMEITGGTMEYIAAEPTTEINPANPDCFSTRTCGFSGNRVTLPAAGVAAIELTVRALG